MEMNGNISLNIKKLLNGFILMIYFQRKEINMSGLLSMIGMQTELDYLIGDFPACFGDTPLAIPKGNIPSDNQKCQSKAQHEFTIKGVKIMAASKKDAIKKKVKRMKHKLRMIWRILRDKQVVVNHGRMYYNWDTKSLEDVCTTKYTIWLI